MKKTGIELIAEERREQIEKHGRTVEQDVEFNDMDQLPYAAQILLTPNPNHAPELITDAPYGWDETIWNKMLEKPYEQRLIIAGALIAAEIDRLQAE